MLSNCTCGCSYVKMYLHIFTRFSGSMNELSSRQQIISRKMFFRSGYIFTRSMYTPPILKKHRTSSKMSMKINRNSSRDFSTHSL